MSFTELLEAAKALPRAEQIRLIEGLQQPASSPPKVELLAKYFPPGETFDVWSPYDEFETAAVLQQMLEERRAK